MSPPAIATPATMRSPSKRRVARAPAKTHSSDSLVSLAPEIHLTPKDQEFVAELLLAPPQPLPPALERAFNRYGKLLRHQ